MGDKKIKTALISVYEKEGLEDILKSLHHNQISILSTGGTADHIEQLGYAVKRVEELTDFPSILDGRVKTLHPAIFGGILAKRETGHLETLQKYGIPQIDCVIVDLYPFNAAVESGAEEDSVLEKIDIGGVSLIRAAAKNYKDVVVVPSKSSYGVFEAIINHSRGITTIGQRKSFAKRAFALTTEYDRSIYSYFNTNEADGGILFSHLDSTVLRYGENPHQKASFLGNFKKSMEQLSGKPLSYNNLLDVDAAVSAVSEFRDSQPTIAIVKHNNTCGFASRSEISEAWKLAFAGDPVSAFGSVICSNAEIDTQTASLIDKIFYEVLIAPGFSKEAIELLSKKRKRILLKLRKYPFRKRNVRSALEGFLVQQQDLFKHDKDNWIQATEKKSDDAEMEDLFFANKVVKHLKSNAIALVKDQMLIGMGAGQTSRVDALKQAIEKARKNKLDLSGAVMASDAFFPFSDCVEIAAEEKISAVVQPGGSIRDKDSINYCNKAGIAMYLTGIRHFKH